MLKSSWKWVFRALRWFFYWIISLKSTSYEGKFPENLLENECLCQSSRKWVFGAYGNERKHGPTSSRHFLWQYTQALGLLRALWIFVNSNSGNSVWPCLTMSIRTMNIHPCIFAFKMMIKIETRRQLTIIAPNWKARIAWSSSFGTHLPHKALFYLVGSAKLSWLIL